MIYRGRTNCRQQTTAPALIPRPQCTKTHIACPTAPHSPAHAALHKRGRGPGAGRSPTGHWRCGNLTQKRYTSTSTQTEKKWLRAVTTVFAHGRHKGNRPLRHAAMQRNAKHGNAISKQSVSRVSSQWTGYLAATLLMCLGAHWRDIKKKKKSEDSGHNQKKTGIHRIHRTVWDPQRRAPRMARRNLCPSVIFVFPAPKILVVVVVGGGGQGGVRRGSAHGHRHLQPSLLSVTATTCGPFLVGVLHHWYDPWVCRRG